MNGSADSQSALRSALNAAGVVLIIMLSTALAQLYLFFGRHESFAWFPAGVSLALLQRHGQRTLVPIFVGLAGYYLIDHQLSAWAAVWTAVTWIAALLVYDRGMHRYGPSDLRSAPIRALVVYYVFGVVCAPAVHTVLDLPMMHWSRLVGADDDLRSYAFSYWLGEANSALLLGPVLYLTGRDFTEYYRGPLAPYIDMKRSEKWLWASIVAVLLALTHHFGQTHFYAGIQDIELILYPMLAWSALRLGVVFTMTASLLVSASVFTFTAFGLAGTPTPQTQQTMLALFTFVLTIAVMAQMLAVQDLERRLRSARLAYAASHDWLTDLGNILSFRTTVSTQIQICKATGRRFALGYIATSEQQILEQGFGVRARNAFLQALGTYLNASFQSDVAVARITGGNFTVLFKDSDTDAAQAELQEVRQLLHEFRFLWAGQTFRVAPDLRLAPVDGSIDDPDRLMTWISERGEEPLDESGIQLLSQSRLDPELAERRKRVQWLAEIQDALASNRLQLYGQPIRPIVATAAPGRLRLEILIRLLNSDGELLGPGSFLPHAERYLLLPRLDQWVFDHTCAWFSARPEALEKVDRISINVSGQSISESAFRERLARKITQLNIPPSKLCFEITESEAISNMNAAVGLFKDVRALGAAVALDDFGTGMSSFEYLKKFHVDYLKIDGMFIRGLHAGSPDYVIVQAIQNVAEALGIGTIAEYVESPAILDCLRELGIQYAQGFTVGEPVPLDQLFSSPAD